MQFTQILIPNKIARWLGLIALYLAAQSLFTEYLLENVVPGSSHSAFIPFIDLFSVNAEQTIPTWYATMLLFVSAVLLALITAVKHQTHDPQTRYWAGLSFIFIYLSIDEGAVIHELFSTPLETAFNTSGYLAFAWLIVFVPLLLIFALLYMRFVYHLPSRTRNLFILAGLFYVGGAVIVEAISANRYALGGVTFAYLAIGTVEELLEMWGVVLFIYALLAYMEQQRITAVITPALSTPQSTTAAPSSGINLRRLILVVGVILLVGNGVIIAWAFQQQSLVANATDTPFYQLVNAEFEDQGVIILGINEDITAGSPTAPPIAASLLTLFDDVMVVSFPTTQVSIAFAGSRLPFTTETLTQLAQQSGETDFTIVNMSALHAIAASTNTP